MLRWCLSTVRTLGGHDTNPSLFRFLCSRTLRDSRFQFARTHTDAAVPAANLVEELDSPVVVSSSKQSHTTEDRYPCKASHSPADYTAIDSLRRYLSPESIASDHSYTYSPTTIRSLYYRAESRNQLGMLDSCMLTRLIGLFGSLSIDPCKSVAYRDPLISRPLEVSAHRTHWAFILKVGRYKLERGIPLQDSDRFWLMRAELAIVQARPLKSLLCDAYNAVLRARTHYLIIRRHDRRPELHAQYLETLLAIKDSRLLEFAARDLSFLLRTHRILHPRLQRLLYRMVVQYGESLSNRSQQAILTALWSRSWRTGGIPDPVPESVSLAITLDNCTLDMTTVARTLSATLFGFTDHDDKSASFFDHLFAVFSPAYALPLRWKSLILLSIFNYSEMPYLDGTYWTGDHAISREASCWQIIFGLATIERIISRKPPSALATRPLPKEGVLEAAHSLYQFWLSTMNSYSVPRDLAYAVTTTFLKIATIFADAALFYSCQDLHHMDNDPNVRWTSTQRLLAAQYIAAATRVQDRPPDVVLTALEDISLDLKQRHQVLTSAVEALAPIDASLAHMLCIVAQEKGMELDPGAIYALAISFAQHGAFRQAILFLNNGQFSLEKRGILISAVARSLRENPRTRHPSSVFVAIINELAALYHSHVPPEHFRGHLEELFVTLARYGRGNQLFPVLLSILKRSPNFFGPQFFVRYYRVLIRHKQFSTVSRLLDAIAAVHPQIARFLRVLRDRTVMRTKTFQTSKRIAPLRGPTSLRLSSRLRRRPFAGPPLGISLQELLNSGRVLAAKHTFACATATISWRRSTALGNILLHGVSCQPTSRNGRRVRKVVMLLEDLVKNHGFQPDRVTVNILIKAMINWRLVFDSQRLRELFDQLVRGGYPAADHSPLHPPFGTRRTQFAGSLGFSKLPSFVSFVKHARPLFKMFIKAFYLCNDVEAARKVIGILKVEEYKNAVAKEVRQKARSRGRVNAGQRNAFSLGATVSSIDRRV